MDQMPDTSQPIRGPTKPDDLRNYEAGAGWSLIVNALKSGWNHAITVAAGLWSKTWIAAGTYQPLTNVGAVTATGAGAGFSAYDRAGAPGNYALFYRDATKFYIQGAEGTIITVNATTPVVAFGATTISNATGQIVKGAFANNTITNRLLDYKEGTDTWSGLAIAATTWTPLGANSAFTVADANSVVAISVAGSAIATAAGALTVGSRLNMNSGSTFENLGGAYIQAATYNNVLDGVGTVYLTGLPTGTNHVQVEIYTSAASTGYCRCSTAPATERLRVGVMEFIR